MSKGAAVAYGLGGGGPLLAVLAYVTARAGYTLIAPPFREYSYAPWVIRTEEGQTVSSAGRAIA